jgi:hypothetical protein
LNGASRHFAGGDVVYVGQLTTVAHSHSWGKDTEPTQG